MLVESTALWVKFSTWQTDLRHNASKDPL